MINRDISEINIIYDIQRDEENIKIFGNKFVENNVNKCKIIIDNKEIKITEDYYVKGYNNKKLIIKLKGINNITDMSYMFSGCSSLSSLTILQI